MRVAPWDRSNLVAAEVRQNFLSEVTTDHLIRFPRADGGLRPLPRSQVRSDSAEGLLPAAGVLPGGAGGGDGAKSRFGTRPLVQKPPAEDQGDPKTRLQDGPEKKELRRTIEAELLKKLIAGKERARARQGLHRCRSAPRSCG